VLGRPNFISVHIKVGWLISSIGLIMVELGRRWEDLEPAWRILANYGQLGDQFICRVNRHYTFSKKLDQELTEKMPIKYKSLCKGIYYRAI